MDLTGKQWAVDARPTKVDEIYGCDQLKTFIKTKAKDDNWPRGILLMGTAGNGKTTAAKIIAMTMVCQHKDAEGNPCRECADCKAILEDKFNRDVKIYGPEFFKKDGESNIDSMRRLIELSNSTPFFGKRRVIILDEFQELMRSTGGQAATKQLLPVLEKKEGQGYKTYWIFTSMDDIQAKSSNVEVELGSQGKSGYGSSGNSGILRRVTQFKFNALGKTDLLKYMYTFANKHEYEGKKLWDWMIENGGETFCKQGLLTIAEGCVGSVGMATKVLQQCIEEKIFDPNSIFLSFGFLPETKILDVTLNIASNIKNNDTFIQIASITKTNFSTVFQIMMASIRRAEQVRVFGRIGDVKAKKGEEGVELKVTDSTSDNSFIYNQALNLSKAPNYFKLRDMLLELSESGYFTVDLFKVKLMSLLS